MTHRGPPRSPPGTVLRSASVGIVATAADLAVLALLVYVLSIDPLLSNVPALLAGAVVQFLGNRNFAFRARSACIRRQAVLFSAVEVVTLLLNGLLFDLMMRVGPQGWEIWPLAARLTGQAAVFLGWSYPAWRAVFRAEGREDPIAGGETPAAGHSGGRSGSRARRYDDGAGDGDTLSSVTVIPRGGTTRETANVHR